MAGLLVREKRLGAKGRFMKNRNGETLSPRIMAEIITLDNMDDKNIDLSDMPEVTDWSGAVRGKFYRPIKQPYSLRLDADVVAWFKASGDGYQTRINAALREYVLAHQGQAKS
jgi:uncharacterized protein (DUF4415 family)